MARVKLTIRVPPKREVHRGFYGWCAIILGVWEAVAYAGRAPTVSSTVAKRKTLWAIWVAGLAYHFWQHGKEPKEVVAQVTVSDT